jgi:hypothetical protein
MPITDFLYLIQGAVDAPESLERENAEMRRRIATFEAETGEAEIEDDFQPIVDSDF